MADIEVPEDLNNRIQILNTIANLTDELAKVMTGIHDANDAAITPGDPSSETYRTGVIEPTRNVDATLAGSSKVLDQNSESGQQAFRAITDGVEQSVSIAGEWGRVV